MLYIRTSSLWGHDEKWIARPQHSFVKAVAINDGLKHIKVRLSCMICISISKLGNTKSHNLVYLILGPS